MTSTIKQSCKAALMLLFIPLITSCTLHQQLPGNWTLPTPAPIGICPDISGQYIGLGETIENKTTAPLVFELFANDREKNPLVRWQEVTHISIQQNSQNLFDITAWKGKEIVYSKSLSKDFNDFICEDGWLKIKSSTLLATSSAFERSSFSRNFAKSDGYLLEKQEGEGIGLILIIPTTGSTVRWYRFAPIKE
jgi:hypothetical protein